MVEDEFVLTYLANEDEGMAPGISAILHRKHRVNNRIKVNPVVYSGGHNSKREARAALQDVVDGFPLFQFPFAGLLKKWKETNASGA